MAERMTEEEKGYTETAREYLKRVLELEIKEDTLEREAEWWKNKAEGCGSMMPKDKVQSSPAHDQMETAIIKLEDVEKRIAEQLIECSDFRKSAYMHVQMIDDAMMRRILYLRYFDFVIISGSRSHEEVKRTRRMSEVAAMTPYNEEYARRMHRNALIALGAILSAEIEKDPEK